MIYIIISFSVTVPETKNHIFLKQKLDMDSGLTSFDTEPSFSSSTTEGTSNNYNSSGSLEFPASSRSAGRSQFSDDDAVSDVVDEKENPMAVMLRTPSLQEFSFRSLKIATNNFSTANIVYEGGFGRVYKGWVDEKTLAPSSKMGTGTAVAIKIWNCDRHQGFDEWQAEVNILGRHYHPNIIGLLGYCWENQMLGLVYEFMQKGSLKNHLFPRTPGARPLSWEIRLKIAIGAAQGLAFLHTLKKKVIYRDFKAVTILLDKNYNAKLSGFGLAILGPSNEEAPISTSIRGTYGYVAPEYIATGDIYIKSDVYGFGVVLLEILTGLRAIDSERPNGKQNLVEWLKPSLSHKRKLKSIMDDRMEGQYSAQAAVQAAELSLKCLESNPRSRPSMKEVVEMLKEIEALEDTAK